MRPVEGSRGDAPKREAHERPQRGSVRPTMTPRWARDGPKTASKDPPAAQRPMAPKGPQGCHGGLETAVPRGP
eukprot:2503970-Pyramimonas_sp.AAC.1